MRRMLLLLVVVLSAGCVVPRRAVVVTPPRPVVTIATFDPYLAPYGTWVVLPGYGRVWQPSAVTVGADFYPYGTGGRWLYTDAGWVFDSDYPFGWAVFHYGRWMRDPFQGWCWVPGDVWGPAWVSWRMGGSYIGWAPLGPAGAPLFHHQHWVFVEAPLFQVHGARAVGVLPGQFHEAVAVTQPVNARVGPPPNEVARWARAPVTPVPLAGVRSEGRVPPPPPPPGRATVQAPPPPPPRMMERRVEEPEHAPLPLPPPTMERRMDEPSRAPLPPPPTFEPQGPGLRRQPLPPMPSVGAPPAPPPPPTKKYPVPPTTPPRKRLPVR